MAKQTPPNYDYTVNERKEKQRKTDEALGLKRREIKAHDDDWPDIKRYANRKLDKRLKEIKDNS